MKVECIKIIFRKRTNFEVHIGKLGTMHSFILLPYTSFCVHVYLPFFNAADFVVPFFVNVTPL